MRIITVKTKQNYVVKFFEFTAINGRTITSFYQVVAPPNVGMCCFDTYTEAIEFMDAAILADSLKIPKNLQYPPDCRQDDEICN